MKGLWTARLPCVSISIRQPNKSYYVPLASLHLQRTAAVSASICITVNDHEKLRTETSQSLSSCLVVTIAAVMGYKWERFSWQGMKYCCAQWMLFPVQVLVASDGEFYLGMGRSVPVWATLICVQALAPSHINDSAEGLIAFIQSNRLTKQCLQ